jgi:hypothetical protein
MPEIKIIAELLDQVGSVITFPDPLGGLGARGFTLDHDVRAKLDAAGHPPTRLDPAGRQQLTTLAGRLGRVRSTVTGASQPPPQFFAASQDYDLVVALRPAGA